MSNSGSSSGIGLPGIFLVLFVALKLMGYINWSWWCVLSPIWITFAIAMLLIAVYFVLMVIQDVGCKARKW